MSPTELGGVHFANPLRAAENMARIRERVPATVATSIAALLGEAPDADAALNGFERLTQTATGEVFRLMERHAFLVHYALVVFGYSPWLGETLIQNTDLLQSLARDRGLDRMHSREEFRENFARVRSRSFETDIALLLARFKRREFVRIMLRDVLGLATLAETTAEISALADVLIEEALRECDAGLKNRYGVPRHTDENGRLADTPFTVLSMGKLGGNELNYSSDVDLLYIYGDGTDAATAHISNRELFIRLAQEVTDVLSRVTREGSVFRIDLRLRPQGAEGEPAIPLGHALRYYKDVAQDWERQALIKVRHSAGDVGLARDFIRKVQQDVYVSKHKASQKLKVDQQSTAGNAGADINFAAIETALDALDKIKAHRRKSGGLRRAAEAIDVKLDRGGIRDIEFLVQCLQRVYGGAEPWLRSGGTLFSLQKLHDKGHISGREFQLLTTSYSFLRTVEHRLQLRAGQQTHRLPASDHELRTLWRSSTREPNDIRGTEVVEAVRSRMERVAEIYNRIIHQQRKQVELGVAPDLKLEAGLTETAGDLAFPQLLQRLAVDAPEIHRVIADTHLSVVGRRNLFRFLGAASTSKDRYAAVLASAKAMKRALPIFAASQFLTDILVRHPDEIAALDQLDLNTALNGDLVQCAAESHELLFDPVGLPHSECMALLRREFRHRSFVSGARDVLAPRPVWEALRQTTAAADAAVRTALSIVQPPAGFSLLALGRMGTCEFDILSDADLLFVRDAHCDVVAAQRAAETVLQLLGAYTRDGSVFALDTRLRPHGTQGELVITPESLERYFRDEAHAWEALTYTKLRFVAGDRETGAQALSAARSLEVRYATRDDFRREVRDMRDRLESAADPENFKIAAGGLYDIDFLVSYLWTTYADRLGPASGTLRERIDRLRDTGSLSQPDADQLLGAAEFLRALEHAIRLVDGRARKALPVAENALQSVTRLTVGMLGRDIPAGVRTELLDLRKRVRERYLAILLD